MYIRRVDDCDGQARLARQKTGGRGDPACPRAYDNNIVFCITSFSRCFAAIGDTSRNTVHIISGSLGGRQNFGQRALIGFVQGPQCGRACARPAITQQWPWQVFQDLAERIHIFIGDEPRLNWEICCRKTHFFRGLLNFFKARLIRPFAVWAVADNSPKACLFDFAQITYRDLR